jgi:hypothetical protein
MPWTIYCHTHVDSGRRYVGLTSQTMGRRWGQHCSQAKNSKGGRWHFPNAIRKFGKNAFSHEVLEVCETLESANEAEAKWIDHFDSRNLEKGFNLMKGGEHIPHPIRKNPWDDPEFRIRAGLIVKTRLADPVFKARNMAASKAALNKPEIKAKISELAKAAARTPETRARRSAASKEVMSRPDVRAKVMTAVEASTKRNYKTHCKHGHDLSTAWYRTSTHRICRICANRRSKEWKARQRILSE